MVNLTYQQQAGLESQLKNFSAHTPFLVSFVFVWGELKSISITPKGAFGQFSSIRFTQEDELQVAAWRYGHSYLQIWLSDLTQARFKDKVKKALESARNEAVKQLLREREQIDAALRLLDHEQALEIATN